MLSLYDLKHVSREWRQAQIPKKSGGMRTLTIPNDDLKVVQSDILQYLYALVGQRKLKVSSVAHGFVPYHDTMTAVMQHDRNSEIFLCCDMEKAFDSLLPMFPLAKLLDAGVPAEYAKEIIDVCTYNGCLPQGGPASPYLLNIAMYDADCMIASYAKKHGFHYTRYADDLVFSIRTADPKALETIRQNEAKMLAEINKLKPLPDEPTNRQLKARERTIEAIHEKYRSRNPFLWFLFGVDTILKSNVGMHLNHKKDHIIFRGSRCKPLILGITIRQDGHGYNADKRFRMEARAAVCNFYHKIFNDQGGIASEADALEWLKIKGRVEYADKCRKTSDEGYNADDPAIQEKYYNPLARKFNELSGIAAACTPG